MEENEVFSRTGQGDKLLNWCIRTALLAVLIACRVRGWRLGDYNQRDLSSVGEQCVQFEWSGIWGCLEQVMGSWPQPLTREVFGRLRCSLLFVVCPHQPREGSVPKRRSVFTTLGVDGSSYSMNQAATVLGTGVRFDRRPLGYLLLARRFKMFRRGLGAVLRLLPVLFFRHPYYPMSSFCGNRGGGATSKKIKCIDIYT